MFQIEKKSSSWSLFFLKLVNQLLNKTIKFNSISTYNFFSEGVTQNGNTSYIRIWFVIAVAKSKTN